MLVLGMRKLLEVDAESNSTVDQLEVDMMITKMNQGKQIFLRGQVKFIRAAFNHSYAITTDNQVYFWGEDFNNKQVDSPTIIFKDK